VLLLDTDVLSLTSPRSRLTGVAVDAWRVFVRENVELLHFSVVTLMEVRFGIERLRQKDATRQAADLTRWLLIAETIHSGRLVPVSRAIAHRAGQMLARAESAGVKPSAEDALIAASAAELGMRLVSRNRRHMEALGIECIDPLESLPR
jgi:predicted nucleic acid-binding protein